MRSRRDVRDDVQLLALFLECALEGEVVVRRHDELVRRPALTEECGQPCEEAVQRPRLDRRLEQRMELVVQRPGALHRRDVLRDPRQVDRPVVRHVEGACQVLGEVTRAVEAEHGHDSAGEQRLDDLGVDIVVTTVAGA